MDRWGRNSENGLSFADIADVDRCIAVVFEKPGDKRLQIRIRIHNFALVHGNEYFAVSFPKAFLQFLERGPFAFETALVPHRFGRLRQLFNSQSQLQFTRLRFLHPTTHVQPHAGPLCLCSGISASGGRCGAREKRERCGGGGGI